MEGVMRDIELQKLRQRAIAKHEYFNPDDLNKELSFFEKWNGFVWFKIFLFFSLIFIAMDNLPNSIWDPEIRRITIILGSLGIWRYSWWFTHAIRAIIYKRFAFPKIREKADKIWEDGYRPRHVHFMMTTFKEERDITQRVIESICSQIRDMGVDGTLWLGSGDIYDEVLIEKYLRLYANDINLNYTIVRQNIPGKRVAIGLVLRAMNRASIHLDDIVVFMDGDAVLGKGSVKKCATLLQADKELQACTTDEEVVCFGPKWIQIWLTMRFAQRRIAMQSHALSNKVLTLTGRMSVFRAKHLYNLKMIRLLEADHLEHWLWGKFRFLSGDDKSTWYYMLLQNAKLLYVPDAMAYTIEVIEGSGLDRMVQNFRRWSGNMLRNGSRALALGPHKIGLFIWWCVLDQRIAMWTMLVSPILAFFAAGLHSLSYICTYLIWLILSRFLLSLVLFCYTRRPCFYFPFILYFNQLINAMVKVYCLFRLSKQKWSNRGNQSAGFGGDSILEKARNTMAFYLTTLYVSMLSLFVLLYSGLLDIPSISMFNKFFLN
jgi:glycosyltransferase Alg8